MGIGGYDLNSIYEDDIVSDIQSVVNDFNEKYSENVTIVRPMRIKVKPDTDGSNIVTTSFYLDLDGTKVHFRLEYLEDANSDYWEVISDDITIEAIAKKFNMQGQTLVAASTYIKAAEEDEDPFSDMGFDDEPEAGPEPGMEEDLSPEDTIDDLTDTLDDLNDALDDFEEDDVDIEMDNNIADHLIAECDKCHNIFITSVIQSDQEVEKISGICPICDEESDQYIKWVVKEL